jgi:hypothetical protein
MYKRIAQDPQAINKDIVSQFSKTEVRKIASIMGLQTAKEDRSLAILDAIFSTIADVGVDQILVVDSEADGELLMQFLAVAEVLNEDGEQIDFLEQEVSESELPDCYGAGDDRDVACRTCRVLRSCLEKRKENRLAMPCFGKEFEGNSEDCLLCIEASLCKEAKASLVS